MIHHVEHKVLVLGQKNMLQKDKEGLITRSKSSAKANEGRKKATNGREEWLQLQGLKDSLGRIDQPIASVD